MKTLIFWFRGAAVFDAAATGFRELTATHISWMGDSHLAQFGLIFLVAFAIVEVAETVAAFTAWRRRRAATKRLAERRRKAKAKMVKPLSTSAGH